MPLRFRAYDAGDGTTGAWIADRLVAAVARPGAARLLSHLALKSPFAACT